MKHEWILLPVIAQVLMTMWVFIGLAKAKAKAVAAGEVNEERRALHEDAWPDSVIQFNNNIRNQFELPTLFYALCFVHWAVQSNSMLVHGLAWLFVISRLVHLVVHTGSNIVPLRRKVFMFGFAVLVLYALAAFFEIAM